MCSFYVLYYSHQEGWGGMWALFSECKIAQGDLTNWMSLLPSNIVDENSPNPDALSIST